MSHSAAAASTVASLAKPERRRLLALAAALAAPALQFSPQQGGPERAAGAQTAGGTA